MTGPCCAAFGSILPLCLPASRVPRCRLRPSLRPPQGLVLLLRHHQRHRLQRYRNVLPHPGGPALCGGGRLHGLRCAGHCWCALQRWAHGSQRWRLARCPRHGTPCTAANSVCRAHVPCRGQRRRGDVSGMPAPSSARRVQCGGAHGEVEGAFLLKRAGTTFRCPSAAGPAAPACPACLPRCACSCLWGARAEELRLHRAMLPLGRGRSSPAGCQSSPALPGWPGPLAPAGVGLGGAGGSNRPWRLCAVQPVRCASRRGLYTARAYMQACMESMVLNSPCWGGESKPGSLCRPRAGQHSRPAPRCQDVAARVALSGLLWLGGSHAVACGAEPGAGLLGARVPQAPQSLRRMPSGRSSARVSSTAFTRQAGMPDLRGSSVRCACHPACHHACCPACCEAPLRLRSGTPSLRVPAWQALEMRWRDLLTQGRAVVAVGDFNICPAPVSPGLFPPAFVFLFALSSYPARTVPPRQGSRLGCRLQIDCAEPDPANHYRSASRRWMRHLLRGTVASAAARGLQQAALPGTAGAQQQPAAPGAAGQLQGGGSSIFDWEAAVAAEAAEEGDGSTSPRWQGSAGPDASSCASCIGGRGSPLSENCCFVDTFRHFHPTRTDVATCWSTLTNARSDRA